MPATMQTVFTNPDVKRDYVDLLKSWSDQDDNKPLKKAAELIAKVGGR